MGIDDNLPLFVVDTMLCNRDIGHALPGTAFLLKAINDRVNDAVDKFALATPGVYRVGAASLQADVKKYIHADTDPATVYFVTTILLGNHFPAWEPETIWLSLLRDHNLDLSVQDRSELLAILAAKEVSDYYYDAAVFKNMAMAFNGFEPAPMLIEELGSPQLCWAVVFGEFARKFLGYGTGYQHWEFDYAPSMYVATVLHREGYIVAPPPLSFAQEALDGLNKSGAAVSKEAVQKKWDQLKSKPVSTLNQIEFGDAAEEVQLSKLANCLSYLDFQLTNFQGVLKPLLKTLESHLGD